MRDSISCYRSGHLCDQVFFIGVTYVNRLSIKFNLPQNCALKPKASGHQWGPRRSVYKGCSRSELCIFTTLSLMTLVNILVSMPNKAGTFAEGQQNMGSKMSFADLRLQRVFLNMNPNLLFLEPLTQRLDRVPVAVFMAVRLN